MIRSNNVFLASKKWVQWLNKWISSSTSYLSHLSQILSFKGVIGLVYLPDSIFNLWELNLNLVMHLLCLGSFIKSRYISKPKFVFWSVHMSSIFHFHLWVDFWNCTRYLHTYLFYSVFTVCLREDIGHDLYLLPPGVFKTLNILERAENHDWPPPHVIFSSPNKRLLISPRKYFLDGANIQ